MSWGMVAVAGASLVGGALASKGAKDAAKAQSQGADKSAQVQLDMFNQARADNEPFRQAGITGLNEYMALLGLPTSGVSNAVGGANSAMSPSGAIEWFDPNSRVPVADPESYRSDPLYKQAWDEVWQFHNGKFDKTSDRTQLANHLQSIYDKKRATTQAAQPAAGVPGTSLTQQQAFDRFRSTPGYQFGLSEGVRALDSSAAAAGGLFSGKAAKALTKFGTDYADQQGYTPYKNSLAALAGIGQTATNQNNSLGQATGANLGQTYQNAGNARASGIAGSANAWGSTLGQLAGIGGYMYGNRGNWGWGGV